MATIDKKDDLDSGEAFLPDPRNKGPRKTNKGASRDSLAQQLGEEFVSSATNAEDVRDDARDATTPDELGGPFVEVDATEEFAGDADGSKPVDGTRGPFPTAIRAAKP